MKLHDQHCHSEYSLDSKEPIWEYFKIANDNGMQYCITTEHIEFDSVANHQDWTVEYDDMKRQFELLKIEYPNITPLLGVEIGFRSDKKRLMENLLAKHSFDLINLSVHDNGKVDYYLKADFQNYCIEAMLDIYFNNIIEALSSWNNFDVLSHLDYGFKTAYLLDNQIELKSYKHYLIKIFQLIIKKNKTVEINLKVQDNLQTNCFLKYWLELYYQCGGRKLTFSSDAHNKEQYQSYYKRQNEYFNIIKDCGFNQLSYFIKRKEYFINL